MCKVLKVSRSSYYKYLTKSLSPRAIENGNKINLKRVQRLMCKLGIKSIVMKKFKPQSSKSKVEDKVNILDRNFSTNNLNEKWVTDITYVHIKRNGWCYLASAMDLCTKKIIGYSFSKNMDTDMALKALDNALKAQKPSNPVILHSDLGTQYTSSKFKEYIERNDIIHSFSRKGNPYDNAWIESFHASLKKEEVNLVTYYDYDAARLAPLYI